MRENEVQIISERGGEAGTRAFQGGAWDGGCLAEERSKPVFVMAKSGWLFVDKDLLVMSVDCIIALRR